MSRRSRRRWAVVPALLALGVLAGWLGWRRGGSPSSSPPGQGRGLPPTDADPAQRKAATKPSSTVADSFESLVVRHIERHGHVTVTLHVALADHRLSDVPAKFGNGDEPAANLYWGALFGVETHLANAGHWRRVLTDDGDGRGVIRRVVFHRRAALTESWRSRGVHRAFDVYVLANAWPSSQTVAAMEQPLRDALGDEPVVLTVENHDLAFGAGSVITGYIGQNWMIRHRWDPLAAPLAEARSGERAPPWRPMGVFYVCSQSAVYLHRPIIELDLYPVLFVREPIVPEAYLVDGLLRALVAGDLENGFLMAAATEYARHQKDVSPKRAAAMLFR